MTDPRAAEARPGPARHRAPSRRQEGLRGLAEGAARRARAGARGAGLQGRGLPARHPARRARRMVGRARRRQCRRAQPLVPRQGGGEPARRDLSGRGPRPRAGGARLAARPVSLRPLQEGERRQGPARAADRRAGADRGDRADRRIDLPGPRPGQHARRRSRPGRAGGGRPRRSPTSAAPRSIVTAGKALDEGYPMVAAVGRAAERGAGAAADRARMGRPAPSAASPSSARASASIRAGSTSSPRPACG